MARWDDILSLPVQNPPTLEFSSETEMRAEMLNRLGQAVDDICKGHGTVDLFEDCMEDFVDVYGLLHGSLVS
ncbi:hypothetical protein Dsin_026660 [Dipteronia sinensis]|uniref:Uncharacterized protein n=1 Tax=Dipteronia sinensis TaxID=43782 RepID=A0AAD9ZY34_9ROSI|nr:hypothetical protein Dsin_026660 [Dipteronia sinensis]